MTDGQLQLPERVELAELTADELQALTPEECFALLPEYTVDELAALRKAYSDEWISLTGDLVDRHIPTREQRREARVRLAEVYRRKEIIEDFHWWKKSNATIDDIKAEFERRRQLGEAVQRDQELWEKRDAEQDEWWRNFHKQMLAKESELYE